MDTFGKEMSCVMLVFLVLVPFSAGENGFTQCDCEDEGFWGIETIMECQKVSDFLIAVAYFSIPIELLYFVSCSDVPFKCVLLQFIAFIVLCGMTHLLNCWTYGPHPFQLMLALTIFKFLTALVSFATAITLITLIPLLLKVKVREFMLKKKAWDLGREVGMIRKQKQAGWHARMLTQEIRKSLDRHTILYTTLDKLSEILDLQNCMIWMPDEGRTVMNLTHELKNGNTSSKSYSLSIPITDPDVREIKGSQGVKMLEPESPLARLSSSEGVDLGSVAAIRMPMLRVCNFKGGTPEMVQACYAILVLVLPGGGRGQARTWTNQELEIVKVVADQVAVALSHAAVLEESQLMRDKLEEQNRALQKAKLDAMMASQARNSCQTEMSNGLSRPMQSIMGLLSILQEENLSSQQEVIVNAMVKTSNVLSMLINDATANTSKDNGKFPLDMRPFRLRSMVREAVCIAKCLCACRGCEFEAEVQRSLPDYVMGDERRAFQVILHMVGNLLGGKDGGGVLRLRIFSESGSHGTADHHQIRGSWRSNPSEGYVYIKFEIGVKCGFSELEGSINAWKVAEESSSFGMCRKLVQMMQGNMWAVPSTAGFDQAMVLVLRFQLLPSIALPISESEDPSDRAPSNSLFRGLRALLADGDGPSRTVLRKLLEKLGFRVSTVSSGCECLAALSSALASFRVVILSVRLPDCNGFEVTARIRKFASRNWPLIVGLVASDDEILRERCLQVGMSGVIVKPVLMQEVAAELRRLILLSNKRA